MLALDLLKLTQAELEAHAEGVLKKVKDGTATSGEVDNLEKFNLHIQKFWRAHELSWQIEQRKLRHLDT